MGSNPYRSEQVSRNPYQSVLVSRWTAPSLDKLVQKPKWGAPPPPPPSSNMLILAYLHLFIHVGLRGAPHNAKSPCTVPYSILYRIPKKVALV